MKTQKLAFPPLQDNLEENDIMKTVSAISAALLACILFGLVSAFAGTPQTQQSQQSKTANSPSKNNAGAARSGCALLPIALLAKTLGEPFDDDPVETKSPPAYKGAWGSACQFFSKLTKGHQTRVDFMVYVEASAADARQAHDKPAMIFEDKSKPRPSGIGDSAYWDSIDDEEPQIHVLKGKVHFSLGIQPANDKQLQNLAAAVAATF
jgi:hypothetical protein